MEQASDDADVIQGYKLRRAAILARRIIGRTYHQLVAFAFGLRIRDTDCDCGLIRRSVLDRVQATRQQ
jgi:hypothetical protein